MAATRRRLSRLGLVGAAVAAALVAPLAVGGGSAPAGAITIGGATSIHDSLSVSFAKKSKERTTDFHLLAFNDFHGTLEPGTTNLYGRYAGGAAYLAKAVEDRQALYGENQLTMFAGDNIGASQLANAVFNEEPTVVISNLMNVDLASVGNHEFDKGKDELLRIQNGGCPAGGCKGAPYALPGGGTTDVYPGADFQYLSANVVVDATGATLFPAYATKRFKSDSGKKVTIGVIGEVLEATPTIVTPAGVAGLTFGDEADAANRAVAELKQQGVDTIVLVIHEGGIQSGTALLNGCAGNLAGSAILDIAARLDPAVKVIVSGHTHQEYRCTITTPDGVTRLVTSASSNGRVLSDVTLTVDDKSGELVAAAANNVLVVNSDNPVVTGGSPVLDPARADPAVTAVVQQYVTASAPLANRVVGAIGGPLTRAGDAQGESTMGSVIADAQLRATAAPTLGEAVIAFMNPGGVRADLNVPGQVTYGQLFNVQPFGNSLVTKTMNGDMLRRLLEQQFRGCRGQTAGTTRVLQVSAGFSYQQDQSVLPPVAVPPAPPTIPTPAQCAATVGKMFLNGTEIQPTDVFRVTMNSFLATGGDNFAVFNEGTNALGGAQDIDALEAHVASFGAAGVPVPALDRIVPKP